MSTLDNKGNYKPFMSNVAAMAYLLAHSPRPMVSSTQLRWHHILYYSHILHGQINLEFVLYTLASFCAIRVIVYEVSSSRVCQSNYSRHLESTNIKLNLFCASSVTILVLHSCAVTWRLPLICSAEYAIVRNMCMYILFLSNVLHCFPRLMLGPLPSYCLLLFRILLLLL